jgi:hypothetical protein
VALSGEATREAPAQAELRPTCAGACRVAPVCDVIPQQISRSIRSRCARWHRQTEDERREKATFFSRVK